MRLLVVLPLLSCSVESWRNADLQVDIAGISLSDEQIVRICVEGVGVREQALGAGRVAMAGLPVQGTVSITVDAINGSSLEEDTGGAADSRLGRAGPLDLGGGETWVEATWQACNDHSTCAACTADGTRAASEGGDRLLAVRFVEVD